MSSLLFGLRGISFVIIGGGLESRLKEGEGERTRLKFRQLLSRSMREREGLSRARGGRLLKYNGGSSSSEVNTIALGEVGDMGDIDDWDAMYRRGSSLRSIVWAAMVEAALCLDLVAMYSVTADLGKKITNVRADETQHPNAPTMARKSVQNMLSFTW